MNKTCFSILILVSALYVQAEDLTGNTFFSAPSTDSSINNGIQQERLSAYYQAMQTLPFRGASSNLLTQAGYNYITPAPTTAFTGYTTTNHKTQTAPLGLSLHPDDYTKFDKTAETYFVPRVKDPAFKSTTKAQPNFYFPRTTVNRNIVQAGNSETSPGTEVATPAQIQSVQTTVNDIKYQNDPEFRIVSQESQQNWRPLPQRQNSGLTSLGRPSSNLVYSRQSSLPNSDLNQLNQQLSSESKHNLTSLHQNLLHNCKNNPSNLKSYEIGQSSQSPLQNQDFQRPTFQPLEKPSYTAPSPSFVQSIESSPNFPASSSVTALNHRRLNLIKSLLAEYLALTQSSVSSESQSAPTARLNSDEAAGNGPDDGLSAESQVSQFPSYSQTSLPSPAANKFIEADQLQRQQYYRAQPVIPSVQRPHSVYGAPYVSNLNTAQE